MKETQRDRRDIFRVMEKETVDCSKADTRSRQFLLPRRILWTQGDVENSQALLKDRELQISLAAKEPCVMKSSEEGKASLLLDYGVEIHGGIRLLAWSDSTNRGAKVRIRFGESASEAMSEPGGESNSTNDQCKSAEACIYLKI